MLDKSMDTERTPQGMRFLLSFRGWTDHQGQDGHREPQDGPGAFWYW